MRARMRTKSAAKVQKKIDTRKEMSIFFCGIQLSAFRIQLFLMQV